MNQNIYQETEELIVESRPKSPMSEAYRELRTNISYLSPDQPLNKLVISSGEPEVGKSLTVANLAVAMAHNEQEVVIIDADLRKPKQHRLYNLDNYQGLTNILMGDISFAEGVQETGINRLKLLSTGSIPPNPAELLSSYKMEEVINQAQERADFVIIDTAPIIAVTDAVILATKVDGILLVAASHQTEKEILKKSKEKLDKANANIIGTVLNKHPIDSRNSYSYYCYLNEQKVEDLGD